MEPTHQPGAVVATSAYSAWRRRSIRMDLAALSTDSWSTVEKRRLGEVEDSC